MTKKTIDQQHTERGQLAVVTTITSFIDLTDLFVLLSQYKCGVMLLADFFVLLQNTIALPPPVEICLFSWYSGDFLPPAEYREKIEASVGKEALKGLKRKKTNRELVILIFSAVTKTVHKEQNTNGLIITGGNSSFIKCLRFWN